MVTSKATERHALDQDNVHIKMRDQEQRPRRARRGLWMGECPSNGRTKNRSGGGLIIIPKAVVMCGPLGLHEEQQPCTPARWTRA